MFDLNAIQAALRDEKLDAWLLYDFRGLNVLARRSSCEATLPRVVDVLLHPTAEMAEANIRLYRRHGFEIVGRGPPDHGLDPHTRVYMVKSFA